MMPIECLKSLYFSNQTIFSAPLRGIFPLTLGTEMARSCSVSLQNLGMLCKSLESCFGVRDSEILL